MLRGNVQIKILYTLTPFVHTLNPSHVFIIQGGHTATPFILSSPLHGREAPNLVSFLHSKQASLLDDSTNYPPFRCTCN
jgi:hypothetical protein